MTTKAITAFDSWLDLSTDPGADVRFHRVDLREKFKRGAQGLEAAAVNCHSARGEILSSCFAARHFPEHGDLILVLIGLAQKMRTLQLKFWFFNFWY